tara:strand:- start:755 stop:1171 length:417 start_codon:yes stop_codon:yes gene_type:complete
MSTLQVGTIKSASSAAPIFQDSSGTEKGQLAKVWANFNQQGTLSLRDSFGVSSISDQGTGRTRINFSTNFSNTDYAVVGAIGQAGTNDDHGNNIMIRDGHSESSFVLAGRVDIEVHRGSSSTAFMDKKTVCLAIFGDN